MQSGAEGDTENQPCPKQSSDYHLKASIPEDKSLIGFPAVFHCICSLLKPRNLQAGLATHIFYAGHKWLIASALSTSLYSGKCGLNRNRKAYVPIMKSTPHKTPAPGAEGPESTMLNGKLSEHRGWACSRAP